MKVITTIDFIIMNNICNPDLCTGCGLCVTKCPKKCISLKVGFLGHLHPQIDSSVCIDCGLCSKSCPVNNPLPQTYPLKCFAGWDQDDKEYTSSSSGGAASAISRAFIKNGGVVYGCAMLPGIDVKHIRVDNADDLYMLKGSKYVQSSIVDCFALIKKDIDNGTNVLFIGTPCQVASVKNFLKTKDELLYTIDLICHGVPSLSLLKKHVDRVTKGVVPDKVFFRESNAYGFRCELNGKIIYSKNLIRQRYEDDYSNTFKDGCTYRDSCYSCKYANPNRVSDITIGDFWGLKGDMPIKPTNGCSVILPITDKGLNLLETIKDDFYLFDKPVEMAIEGNTQLRHPMPFSNRVRVFRRLYPVLGITLSYRISILDKYLKIKIKKLLHL